MNNGSDSVLSAIEAGRPFRSVLNLHHPYRARVLGAIAIFPLKDAPQWLLPVVTANVIDIVVDGGPTSALFLWAAVAILALLQNYPTHVLYTRLYLGTVRQLAADLRNALTLTVHSLAELLAGGDATSPNFLGPDLDLVIVAREDYLFRYTN